MQIDIRSIDPNRLNDMEEILFNSMNKALDEQNAIKRSGPDLKPVSYTHLTLPTM